jgi:hypothetical protein
MTNSFLYFFAKQILDLDQTQANICVVIPSKRAKVFFINTIKSLKKNCFLPKIITIEEFLEEITAIQTIDATALLMEFYQFYLKEFPNDQQTFSTFLSWAKTLLYDFKDIDGYIIDPDRLFPYLKEVKALERWELEPNQKTDLIDKQLAFWDKLPKIYASFYNYLKTNKIGHSGMIQRESLNMLDGYLKSNNQYFVFGGFNALNNAEQQIFQKIINHQKGQIIWDVDEVFLKDPMHLASHFINQFKTNWSYYKNHPLTAVFDNYKKPKTFYIYQTIKSIGQAKLIGNIIEQNNFDLDQTAIILPDETLLLPLINHLPKKIDALNITMGYPALNNPIQFLINDFFILHQKAKTTSKNSSIYYFKHVIALLQNPFINELINPQSIVNFIKTYNVNYITSEKILSKSSHDSNVLQLLFDFKFSTNLDFLDKILDLIKAIKNYKNQSGALHAKIDLAFIYSIYQSINQLKLYLYTYKIEDHINLLFDLYKDQVSGAQVSFEGKPLQGLQIMGMLESRMLDFETLIIPSCNEGVLPPKPRQQSIVPFDIKKEEGMPTQLEQDALITYHFYRLISRAKKVYLIYDGDDGQGLTTGERSRFIEQIRFENLPNHEIIEKSFVPNIQITAQQTKIIKTEHVQQQLQLFAKSGFSASSISNYLRNPKDFFVNNLLRLREAEEVEESIAANTLGNVIHKTLEELYKPYINSLLTVDVVKLFINTFEKELVFQYQAIFKEGDLTKGKNLIAFEMSKKLVFDFLKKEMEAIKNGNEIIVLACEQTMTIELKDDRFPYPVFLKGNIDRIEKRNGVVRIIDYKTGKVEPKDLSLNVAKKADIFSIKTEKIMQLLCYALLMQKSDYIFQDLQVGIVSFKNLKDYMMLLTEKEGHKILTDLINEELLESFEFQLKDIIWEIINPELPFLDQPKRKNINY